MFVNKKYSTVKLCDLIVIELIEIEANDHWHTED